MGNSTSLSTPACRRASVTARRFLVATALASVCALGVSGCTIDKDRLMGAGEATASSTATKSGPNPTPGSQPSAGDRATVPGSGAMPAALIQAVADVEAQYGGQVGVALANPGLGGGKSEPASAGALQIGPAWSTSKVPIAVAVARTSGVTDAMTAAITASDNASAEAMWASLGNPATAGATATQVLRDGGDTVTNVETAKVRPEFSAFGQTRWALEDQATFGANLQCIAGGSEVANLMGRIVGGQAYGLGTIEGAHFKGGWGPDESGAYLTRQFGFIPGEAPGSFVGVAIAAKPADGTYETGQAMLSALAAVLAEGTGRGDTC
nr:hypothetical protein [Corynebacterium lactis]